MLMISSYGWCIQKLSKYQVGIKWIMNKKLIWTPSSIYDVSWRVLKSSGPHEFVEILDVLHIWHAVWLILLLAVFDLVLLNIKYLKSRVSVNTPCTSVTITLDFHYEGSQSIPWPGSMRIFLIFSGLQDSFSVLTNCFRTATIVLDLLI